jgi:hypothetical protein
MLLWQFRFSPVALDTDTLNAYNYTNLCVTYTYLDRLDEAEAVIKQTEGFPCALERR